MRQPRLITWKGETHTIAEWAMITNKSPKTIRSRIKIGWPLDKVLTEPVKQIYPKGFMPCGAKSVKDCFNCQMDDCIAPPNRRLEGE